MNRNITAPVDNSHTHGCVVCDAQIACDNPEDAQLCEVGAMICAPCEEGFRDQDSGEPSDDRERTRLGEEESDDGFEEMFRGEDQVGKAMLEASQAVVEIPHVSKPRRGKRRPVPRLFRDLKAG